MAEALTWEKWAVKLINEMPLYHIKVEVPLFVVEEIISKTGWDPTKDKDDNVLGIGIAGQPLGELAIVVQKEESNEAVSS